MSGCFSEAEELPANISQEGWTAGPRRPLAKCVRPLEIRLSLKAVRVNPYLDLGEQPPSEDSAMTNYPMENEEKAERFRTGEEGDCRSAPAA
jgi:hypothetical protein